MSVEFPITVLRQQSRSDMSVSEPVSVDLLFALDSYISSVYVPEQQAAVKTIATGDNSEQWQAYLHRTEALTVSQHLIDRLTSLSNTSADPHVSRWAELTLQYLTTSERQTKKQNTEKAKKDWAEKYQLLHYIYDDKTIPDPPEQFFGGDAINAARRKVHDQERRRDMHNAIFASPESFLHIMEVLRISRNALYEDDYATHTLKNSHEMSPQKLHELIELVKYPAVNVMQQVLGNASHDANIHTIKPWDIGYLTDLWSQRHFTKFLKPWDPIAAISHTRIPYTPDIQRNMRELVSMLGFSDAYETIHVDWESRRGKQLDRAVNVDAPFSVHVLINPTNHTTLFDYLTPFREFGHGLHFSMIDPMLPYVMRNSNETWTEGVGEQVFSTLAVEQLARDYKAPLFPAFHAINHLQTIATCLQYIEFELEYYRSDRNPVVIGNEIFKSYFPTVDGDHPLWWVQNRYIAEYPLYCINYVLAAMISSQIIAYGKRHFTDILSKEFGEFLRETCYKPGRRKPWMELLKDATGEDLNPTYYIHDIQEARNLF